MRPLIVTTLTFLFATSQAIGQTEISGTTEIETDKIAFDTINLSPNKNFEKKAKIKPIDKVDGDIEIRFYKLNSLSNTNNLKIIRLKDNKWTAHEYNEWNRPMRIKKYSLNVQNGFQIFLKKLLQQNISSLPSQNELKDKMRKLFNESGRQGERQIIVNDGHHYTVELKFGESFRIYGFSNPETYANFYEDVVELKNYVAITNLFDQELSRK